MHRRADVEISPNSSTSLSHQLTIFHRGKSQSFGVSYVPPADIEDDSVTMSVDELVEYGNRTWEVSLRLDLFLARLSGRSCCRDRGV